MLNNMPYLFLFFSRECPLAFLILVSAPLVSFAQGDDINNFSSLENRAQALSEKLEAHQSALTEILSRADPIYLQPRLPQPKPSQPVPPAPRPIAPATNPGTIPGGRLPAPRYDRTQPKPDSDTSTPTPASQWGGPDIPLRNDGYYVGLSGGNVLPLDSGVRWGHGFGGASMQFENGYLAGVLLGRDFGFIRVEAEHDAIYYDQKNGTGSAEVHPVLFRTIFEKELGTRIDLRAGIGAGITLAQLKYGGKTFGGVSFCYDFLLGTGIRFNESLALNLDYRYFLTAASDDYRRLQSNLLIASLQFDL